jgi:hypothetical protein
MNKIDREFAVGITRLVLNNYREWCHEDEDARTDTFKDDCSFGYRIRDDDIEEFIQSRLFLCEDKG